MRATTLAAGGLACAGAAMTIAAFAGGGGRTTTTAAPARDGLAVWVANGCGSCHTFAPASSSAPIGPDLMDSLRGKDRTYIERAILAPGEGAPPDYAIGGMPEDFATRISPSDLRLLVDFIHRGVAAQ